MGREVSCLTYVKGQIRGYILGYKNQKTNF